MQRRLIVLRHAKSSWKTDAPTDHDRPLNRRGRHDAPRVARRLAELDWLPQRILSSDSARTRETLKLMADRLGGDTPIDYLRSLYHAGADAVGPELAKLPVEVTTAMIVGHNPGWEDVVQWLAGESVRLATGTAALLETSGASWADALARAPAWRLHDVIRPKEL